ncbi:NAD-dependent epimerase/dehydratase family protein [Streptococcus suis]
MDNLRYCQDIEKSMGSILSIKKLKNQSILITGSTGLIGSAIVDQLIWLNKYQDYSIKIYVASRDEEGVRKRFGKYFDSQSLIYVPYDARSHFNFSEQVDYLIHAASPASPNLYVSNPVDTMLSNFVGMNELLLYAKRVGTKGIVYISSSEVYGVRNKSTPFKESDYGYLDILDHRSSYASSKRATETLCHSYAKQYEIPVKIVRPGHIYGPSATTHDWRLSSDFMFKAIRSEELVLKSSGQQLRSYCYSLDCASAIIAVLLDGKSGEAYNISGQDVSVSIRELSELIANVSGVTLSFDLPNDLEIVQANPMLNSCLDNQRLLQLGWRSNFTTREGIESTYFILKECRS